MAVSNGVMMQYFHWYLREEDNLWQQVAQEAENLAEAGITALWLPPAYKGMGGAYDVGYAVYDMYDLGEFGQKGTVRTKYGDRQEYIEAIEALHRNRVQVYADAVLNHRMGGDHKETLRATPYRQNDRLNPAGGSQEIEAYTHFSFSGRQGKYSDFEWHWWHFDATDYDDRSKDSSQIYLFEGKQFDDYVALEKGNLSYLMGCDVDFQNPEVQQEIKNWGKWTLTTTNVDGFRLDAIKHISAWYFPLWIDALEKFAQKDLVIIGEYWQNNLSALHWYLDSVGGRMSVFDIPLHYNFHAASRAGGNYDMRRILNGTLMQQRPFNAVTFVENHDSQPLRALESPVESWFKPLAYALILLRQEGYPCIFYADYYGASYEDYGKDGNQYPIYLTSHRWLIDKFLQVRRDYLYGPQYNYFDHWNCIGWTCLGNAAHPKAMVVIMSDGPAGWKWMEVGKPHAEFRDMTEHITESVYANEYGWAELRCQGGSVSVWVQV